MHVGRVDRPLAPPRWPWEVAAVAFEVARRHRFMGDIAALPDGLDVHVLPTGQPEPPTLHRPHAVPPARHRADPRAHRARLPGVVRLPRRGGAGVKRVPPWVVRRGLLAPAVSRSTCSCCSSRRSCSSSPRSSRRSSAARGRCGRRSSPSSSRRATSRPSSCCSGSGCAAASARGWARAAMQAAHYEAMRRFVAGVYRAIVRLARVRVTTEESDAAYAALSSGARPGGAPEPARGGGRHPPRHLRAALPARPPPAGRAPPGAAARPAHRPAGQPAAEPVRRPARRRHRGRDRGDGADARRRGRAGDLPRGRELHRGAAAARDRAPRARRARPPGGDRARDAPRQRAAAGRGAGGDRRGARRGRGDHGARRLPRRARRGVAAAARGADDRGPALARARGGDPGRPRASASTGCSSAGAGSTRGCRSASGPRRTRRGTPPAAPACP